MYTISADKELLYAPNLNNKSYSVLEPKLTVELNKAGSLEFKLPYGNNKYESVQKLKSVLVVEQDGEEIWRGRTLSSETDFYKQKHLYNEGELAYLLDSIVRPYSHSGGVEEYFRFLIEQHNEQVDKFKRFQIGKVTVTDKDNNDYIVRANKNYPDTFSELSDKLLNNLGGYLKIRCEDGRRYLDYLAEPGEKNTQVIQFGVNLLDLNEYINAEDVFTVLIPLGVQDQSEEDSEEKTRLTIASVNDGKDYIEDETGIKLFGRITKKEIWDDVTLPENLKEKGTDYLKAGIEMAVTLTIKAVDLASSGVQAEWIKVGDYVRVISIPHDIDTYFLCSKIVYDLSDASKTEYTLGVSFGSLTDRQAESSKTSTTVLKLAESANESAANAVNVVEEIKESTNNIVSQKEFRDYQKTAEGTFAKKESIPAKVSQLENDAGYVDQEVFDDLEKRIQALEEKETK